jgi:sialic acid synthase SpsE
VFQALGGAKNVLPEEQPTIDFAYASVVTTAGVSKGDRFTRDNLWVKRPGTGEILAARYEEVLGRMATRDIAADALLAWSDVGG